MELCERISCGESLKAILREDGFPDERNVYRWLESNEVFRQQYVRAREAQADADADAVNDIGYRTLSGEYDSAAARVAIDALKWSAGKRKPKVYGDRQVLAGDPDAPLGKTEADVDARLAVLLTAFMDKGQG